MNKSGFMNKYRFVLIYLLIVLLLEIFAFNYRFWLYGNSKEVYSPNFYFEDGTPVEYGKSYAVQGYMVLLSEDLNTYVKNIHLGISDCNNKKWKQKDRQCVVHVTTSVMDEGHAQFYDFPGNELSPLVPDSMYLPVEAFGKVNKFKLTITDELDEIVFENIEVNGRLPFRFNIFRLLALFAVLTLLYLVLFTDYHSSSAMSENRKKSYVISIFFVLCLITVVLLIQRQSSDWGSNMGYARLAKAFSEGRVYLKENTDEILAGMENPYDAGNREALGAKAKWDAAFYQNKYYVYFGVIPAIVLYLPFYLITGREMIYMTAACIIDVLLVTAGFFLMNELRRKISKELSLRMFLLLSTTFTFSSGLILLIKRASIYYVAIGMGLVFTLFGLGLWIRSLNDENSGLDGNVNLFKGALGSLFMACAVGCRPQFAMASFLGLIIFRELFKRDRKSLSKLIILLLPYVPVAAGLMWYNYVRFGSPFDFGANYNLTGYDMVHMGVHIARIPAGIWYYLFNLPKLNFEFPFMFPEAVTTRYQGFMVSEPVIGGAVMMAPLVWLCAFDIRNGFGSRRSNKNDISKNSFVNSLFSFRIMCYLIVLIVVVVDTLMCGVLVRYQTDFRLYLMIPAVMIGFEILDKSSFTKEDYNKRARAVAALCVATLVVCVLTVFCQYENPDYTYHAINPVFFCKMRMFFGG